MAAPEQWNSIFDIGSVGNTSSSSKVTSTAVLRDGWIVVTWWDPILSQVKYRIFNTDGTAFANEIAVSSAVEKTLEEPNVAALSDGRFIVAYENYEDISGFRSLSLKKYDVFDGVFDGSVVDNAAFSFGTVISSFADGSYNITYEKDYDGIKYYHHRSSSGSDTSYYGEVEGLSSANSFGAGAVSVDQASYAILYKRDDIDNELYINIRNKNGDSVAKKLVGKINNEDSAVAALSNGNYVVAYIGQSNPKILYAKVFSSGGILLSGEIVLYQSSVNILQPSVQKGLNGSFVFGVAEGSSGTLRLGTFSGSGIDLFQIDSGSPLTREPGITALNDGRFFVSWRAGTQLKGQIFDPRTAPVDWTGNDIGQQFAGTKFSDHLRGSGGNDTLFGSAGNDTLNGGEGIDRLDGGADWDLATYLDTPAAQGGVIVDLSDNSNNGGAAHGDVLKDIESLQGTNQDDRLTSVDRGSGHGAELRGEGGNDTLTGKGGGDLLYGGAGNDTLEGGDGSDILDGGADWDRVTYLGVTGQGVVVNLTTKQHGGAAAGDTLTDIESLQGTNQDDTLTSIDRGGGNGAELLGEGGNDTLIGKAGGDLLYGGVGNDTLEGGGAGADRLDGGDDWDQVTYAGVTDQGVTVNLATNQNGEGAAGDELISIEEVIGTNQRDVITGVTRANGHGVKLWGMGGNDDLIGAGGADSLVGGSGNDWFFGDLGSDTFEGGADWDVVSYLPAPAAQGGIVVDLLTNENGGGAAGDRLIDIEEVVGTNQNDIIRGITRAEGHGVKLWGMGGDDDLVGRGGADSLSGGADSDWLFGDAGADTLDGGEGEDTASFSGNFASYTITGNQDGTFTITGQDGTDLLKNMEFAEFADAKVSLLAGTINQAPVIDNLSGGSVSEDKGLGTEVGTFSAHDPEDGQAGLVFALKDEQGNDANAGGLFVVDPVTGKLTVANPLPDGAGDQTFQVTLKVNDKNGGPDSLSTYKTFTIRVKDVVNGNHAPDILTLNGGTAVTINENVAFTGTLSAQDEDSDTSFTWTFDNTVAGNANSLFEIDNSGTGNKKLKLKAGIDYEALPAGQKFVTVYLKASDGKDGGTSATQAFKINIANVNEVPTGITLSGDAVAEYAMAGTQAGTLSATDADHDRLSYALIDNAGGRFVISGNRILVADGFRLDFEQAQSHNVTVQVSDGKGGVANQTFTIRVGDINPEFTAGTAGNDVFHGGAMNDVLLGNAGHDRLFGGAGKDTLKGEAGNDTLGGGAGLDKLYGTKGSGSRDAFVFDTRLTSKSLANKNKDVIYDFGPKYDSIFFDDAAFTNKTIAKYLKGKGASLDHATKMKSSFVRVGDKALDRDDFFIAKKVKSKEYKLYWDADGSGSKAMLEIGTVKLQKGEGTSLTYKDFFFI